MKRVLLEDPTINENVSNLIRMLQERQKLKLNIANYSTFEIYGKMVKQFKELENQTFNPSFSIKNFDDLKLKNKLMEIAVICIFSAASIDEGVVE